MAGVGGASTATFQVACVDIFVVAVRSARAAAVNGIAETTMSEGDGGGGGRDHASADENGMAT